MPDSCRMDDLQLVIFDCDGVLVDSEPIANRVLAQMISAEGMPMTTQTARANFQGMRLQDVPALVETGIGHALPPDWLEAYERKRSESFRRELTAVPGARHAVAEVRRAGCGACVASQAEISKTELSLELTGLRSLFRDAELFSATEVPQGKPHPDIFLHAAGALGAAPAQCLVVEDTVSGVTAARAAGIRVLGYTADSDAAALQAAGAETFASMYEVPRLAGLA